MDPDPRPGIAESRAVPAPGAAALRGPALKVPLTLLAAHATVLAALSGERDVVTGYVAAGGPPAALPADDRARLVAESRGRGLPGGAGAAGPRRLPGR